MATAAEAIGNSPSAKPNGNSSALESTNAACHAAQNHSNLSSSSSSTKSSSKETSKTDNGLAADNQVAVDLSLVTSKPASTNDNNCNSNDDNNNNCNNKCNNNKEDDDEGRNNDVSGSRTDKIVKGKGAKTANAKGKSKNKKEEKSSANCNKIKSKKNKNKKDEKKEEEEIAKQTKTTCDYSKQAPTNASTKVGAITSSSSGGGKKTTKSLVEELKLFQNNNLLNQQDPMEQLHKQLSQLMANDGSQNDLNNNRISNNLVASATVMQPPIANHNRETTSDTTSSLPVKVLPTNEDAHQLVATSIQQQHDDVHISSQPFNPNNNRHLFGQSFGDSCENTFTVKKGVLWQQQHYDKFHQRIFNRWKKRYFILTTDYLVCFKRSTSKVGHSEMGKFLYKTSLSDVLKIERSKPKASDKGPIVLHFNGQFNLFLWCKVNLDDWMFMLNESILRNKARRSCQLSAVQNNNRINIKQVSDRNSSFDNNLMVISKNNSNGLVDATINQLQAGDELYENAAQIVDQEATDINRPLDWKDSTKDDDGNNNHLTPSREAKVLSNGLGKDNDNHRITDQVDRSKTIIKYSKNHQSPSRMMAVESEGSQQNAISRNGADREEEASGNFSSDNQGSADKRAESSAKRKHSIERKKEVKEPQVNRQQQQQSPRRKDDKKPVAELPLDINARESGRAARGSRAGSMVIYDPFSGSNDDTNSNSAASSGSRSKVVAEDGRAKRRPSGGGSSPLARDRNKNGCSSNLNSHNSGDNPKQSAAAANAGDCVQDSLVSGGTRKQSSDSAATLSSVSSSLSSSSASRRIGNSGREKRNSELNLLNKKEVGATHHVPQAVDKVTVQSTSCDITTTKIQTTIEQNLTPSGNQHARAREQEPISNLQIKTPPTTSQEQAAERTGVPPEVGRQVQRQAQAAGGQNLIRRDESWQSLVSLSTVGKATPVVSGQGVAQRSLYSQQIMAHELAIARADGMQSRNNRLSGGAMSGLESSITPSRGPFLRHDQPLANDLQQQPRRFRPLPPIGSHPQSASFDLPSSSSGNIAAASAALRQSPMNRQTSYQQKLLQLQLLHSSNNIDYARNNNNIDDYQIYGPESTVYGGLYGYSSMRSNLKSAASEFSFIRPSNLNQQQSTLPHPPNNRRLPANDNRQPGGDQQRSSLMLLAGGNQIEARARNNEASCLSPMAKQFLVNPMTGERIINQQLQSNSNPLAGGSGQPMGSALVDSLGAPTCDLPQKPSKRRLNDPTASHDNKAGGGSSNNNKLPKSSSLTSSIACFFRRAFSRRSSKKVGKRKGRSKLPESCSSSLGAFGDGYEAGPLIPSAFSTGSKSIVESGRVSGNHGRQQVAQSPRMIDMIEAFASRTRQQNGQPPPTPLTQPALPMNKQSSNGLDGGSEQKQPQQQQVRMMALNQFGSPLHKSNSISATMGLSSMGDSRGQTLMYDNAIALAASGGSPLLMRSTKVMSANLTPLAGQSQAQQQHEPFGLDPTSFLSPRNTRNSRPMPRPSSIYGQPSMISSPIMSRDDLRLMSSRGQQQLQHQAFGIHRNSLHQFSSGGGNNNIHLQQVDQPNPRRHHHQLLARGPFPLDTTREVAEELSSPLAESVPLVPSDHNNLEFERKMRPHDNFTNEGAQFDGSGLRHVSASPSSSKLLQLNQRQAVVNPIIQSPTMGTIYDNHPAIRRSQADCDSLNQGQLTTSSSYSHYDNHNPLSHMAQMSSPSSVLRQQQSSLRRRQLQMANHQPLPSDDDHKSPMHPQSMSHQMADNNPYYRHQFPTPSHRQRPASSSSMSLSDMIDHNSQSSLMGTKGLTQHEVVAMAQSHYNKPAAIVLPTAPINHPQQMLSRQPDDQLPDRLQHRSPMMARRFLGHHQPQQQYGNSSNYQQSPLVSAQTRVLHKGDGVQATVIERNPSGLQRSNSSNRVPESVVNIAGAPGINLDPSLAATLLRGTNIDAYECSTQNGLNSSNNSSANNNTFLVATRLSKSMAYNSNTGDEESYSSLSNNMNGTNELSSSGSRSFNSSSGDRSLNSLRFKGSNNKTASSSHEDQPDDSSFGLNDTQGLNKENKKKKRAVSNKNNLSDSNFSKQTSSRRGSSSEPSAEEELDSRESSLDKSEERNWITSKLVDEH